MDGWMGQWADGSTDSWMGEYMDQAERERETDR